MIYGILLPMNIFTIHDENKYYAYGFQTFYVYILGSNYVPSNYSSNMNDCVLKGSKIYLNSFKDIRQIFAECSTIK